MRPKTLAQLEDCCLAEIYKRLNAGEYESYLDGAARMIGYVAGLLESSA